MLKHIGCISRMRLGQFRGVSSQISLQQAAASLIKPYLVSSLQTNTHARDLCPFNPLFFFRTQLTPPYLHCHVRAGSAPPVHVVHMLTRRQTSLILPRFRFIKEIKKEADDTGWPLSLCVSGSLSLSLALSLFLLPSLLCPLPRGCGPSV